MLKALGYDLLLTHCHFGLRGEEADRDLEFCRLLAETLGLPFREVHFDTRTYAAEHHLSIEMACRELRYDWWQREFLDGHPSTRLCVGHHADDSAETFLMNLMRGTGIRGLVGIPPRNGAVVRPLLCLSRQEILQYLEAEELTYITDSTNLENEYQRNRVRNQLLPLMEEVNPNARSGLAETMSHLRQTLLLAEVGRRELVERHVTTFRRDGVTYQRLAREAFSADYPAEGLVHLFLQDRAPLSRPLEQEVAAAVVAGKRNVQFGNRQATLYLDADGLTLVLAQDLSLLARYQENTRLMDCPFFELEDLTYSDALRAEIAANADPEVAYIDLDKVSERPLTWQVRRWHEGDRIRPLGMTAGTKLVSDLFSNAHFTPLQKSWTWVVTCGSVLWVSGLRLDDRYKVEDSTRHVLKVVHRWKG
jgi:tRNA(Ile)-lysidine synthase